MAGFGFFLLLFSSLLVVYWAAWIIYAQCFHPLSKVPGPWIASVSRLWYIVQVAKGDMEKTQRQLHAKHGPLIRIAPNELACAAPDAIKTIYPTSLGLNKTDFYPVWNTHSFSKHRDMFSETNDKAHGERRRIINHVYSLANVLQSEPYIDHCSALFLERLGEHTDSEKPFDLGKWLQMFTFDVIGELYFGNMFGFLEKAEDHGNWIHSLDLLMPYLCMTAVAPAFWRPLVLTTALAVPGALKALKAIDDIGVAARECVAARFVDGPKTEGQKRTDLFEQLYTIYKEKGDKIDFKMGDIEQEAYVALFAGSDTTAIGMRSVFYHLMRSKQIYGTLMEEIDSATKEGRLSSPVKYAEAIKLPYLCACIKEALRVHPGVQLSMGRVVSERGMTLCGTFIPAGYWVGMNSAVVHFDKTIFGDDADQYRPERWLESAAAAATMNKHMLHFGAGTRTCIGKNISLAEIHKLIPDVLKNFELELFDKRSPWVTKNLWFAKQENILVRLKKRQAAE
ncbi:cytochrome P450 oxidoreductase [Xylariales sp. AK1849]|nr:cytochrome P450 oxidoreductase [Xylariales sp. AK1849]